MRKIIPLISLFILTNTFANPGPLFNISINSGNLIITPTTNRHYNNMGIKFTSTHSFPNCQANSKGYCEFAGSTTSPKTLAFSGTASNISGIVCLNAIGPASCEKFNLLGIGASFGGGRIACLGGGLNDLIAANTDSSSGIIWGGYGTVLGASSVTDGQSNTQLIVNTLGNNGGNIYAALVCDELTEGGFTDWFVPSQNQLICLNQNKDQIGNFVINPLADSRYWSSTEGTEFLAFNIVFNGDIQGFNFKNTTTDRVRCVRHYNRSN